jgi:hypothetical protein
MCFDSLVVFAKIIRLVLTPSERIFAISPADAQSNEHPADANVLRTSMSSLHFT